jgi:hypothetical protein
MDEVDDAGEWDDCNGAVVAGIAFLILITFLVIALALGLMVLVSTWQP